MIKKYSLIFSCSALLMACGYTHQESNLKKTQESIIPNQENSWKKEDSSIEKTLTQEESLKKCEEQELQKNFLLRQCGKTLSFQQKCEAYCENGTWKIKKSLNNVWDF